jgi:RHS repeat-associated protein
MAVGREAALNPCERSGFWDPYGYTGRPTDAYTKMQYNRARYYDADIARWLTQDPLGLAAGDPNLYRYVSGNPVNYKDPTGLIFEDIGDWFADRWSDVSSWVSDTADRVSGWVSDAGDRLQPRGVERLQQSPSRSPKTWSPWTPWSLCSSRASTLTRPRASPRGSVFAQPPPRERAVVSWRTRTNETGPNPYGPECQGPDAERG